MTKEAFAREMKEYKKNMEKSLRVVEKAYDDYIEAIQRVFEWVDDYAVFVEYNHEKIIDLLKSDKDSRLHKLADEMFRVFPENFEKEFGIIKAKQLIELKKEYEFMYDEVKRRLGDVDYIY